MMIKFLRSMLCRSRLAALLLMFCADFAGAAVQSSANYNMTANILSSAGGAATSAEYALQSAAGQSSPIGLAASAGYKLSAGFFSASFGKTGQTIGFANPGSQVFGTTPSLTATASSGLTPDFTSSTPGVCTVTSGGALGFVTTGLCTVNADQAGDASYAPALRVTQSFSVIPAGQTISFGAAPGMAVGDTATLSASGGGSGNPVLFTSLTSTVCTTSGSNGSVVTAALAGTCTIAANQAGNANYNPAPQATQDIPVAPAYNVTYDGNGNTGGSAPIDAGLHAAGRTVTVLGNSGGLVRAGYLFAGWNSAADGSGTAYATGAAFAMGAGNLTLYARWNVSYPTTISHTMPGSSGIITASVLSNPPGCGFSDAQFGALPSAVAASAPANMAFPAGMVSFTVAGTCGNGASATLSVTYPMALPASAQFWKYGQTGPGQADHWYRLTVASNNLQVAGNTVTYTVTDGGYGDDDYSVNGVIVDPLILAVPDAIDPVVASIPTLSEWGLLILAMLLAAAAFADQGRRRRGCQRTDSLPRVASDSFHK